MPTWPGLGLTMSSLQTQHGHLNFLEVSQFHGIYSNVYKVALTNNIINEFYPLQYPQSLPSHYKADTGNPRSDH